MARPRSAVASLLPPLVLLLAVARTAAGAAAGAACDTPAMTSLSMSGPFFSVEDVFPKLAALREHWQEMRDEATAIQQDIALPDTPGSFDKEDLLRAVIEAGNNGWTSRGNGWKNYVLVVNDQIFPGVTESLCPLSTSLLRHIRGLRLAGFSKLQPNARIETHTDNLHRSLSFHVHLTGHARMRVDNLWVDHFPGHTLIFDANRPHEVVNGDAERIIFYAEVDLDKHFEATEGVRPVFPAPLDGYFADVYPEA